jgi:opacity protein-like surface antigen
MTVAHPEIRAFGAVLDEYQVHGAAIQLAGGAEFALTRRLFVLGEYKFTSTSPLFEIGGATIDSSFATHHVVAGLGWRF